MADLKPGVSSPQVAALQKRLNDKFGYKLPVDGAYDESTKAAVADLQGKMDIGYSSGIVDDKTLKAMADAEIKRTRVVIKDKEYWVTKEQWMTLRSKAGAQAGDVVKTYVSMANEAKMYWEAHDKARRDNWFWSEVVDVAVGTKFPDKGMIDRAIRAADKMESDARACKLKDTDLSNASAPIREAFAAMDQYREELFGGGEELVKNLQIIQGGCVLTLQVAAAVATGGASWEIQVGGGGGL